MIRVGLIDTTIPGVPGSMARYREQLAEALYEFGRQDVDVSTLYLGCDQTTLNRTTPRLRMWRRHAHAWWAARRQDVSQFDVVHVLDGSFGYVATALRSSRVVVTVHDVIPRLQMDGVFPGAPPVGRGARWLIGRCLNSIQRASLVCADSQSTAKDLQRFGSIPRGGIEVVPLAVERKLFQCDTVTTEQAGVDGPFLFHLGNNGFYKNRAATIEVFRRIDPELNLHLVLAGPEPDDRLKRLRDESGLAGRIVFANDPDQERLMKLYGAASVFLFPSRYEGFGWPPLEAMAAGCPVVASDGGSLPEVIGQAGVVVGVDDYDAMAEACERLLTDATFREDLIAAGRQRVEHFSKRRLAESMAAVYCRVADR